MNFFERLNEPSSYAGFAAVIYGFGELFKLDNTTEIAQAVVSTGQSVVAAGASTESLIMGAAGLLAGIFAIFKGEKK